MSLAVATASSSVRKVSTVTTGPKASSTTTDIPRVHAVQHGRQVVETGVVSRALRAAVRRRSAAARPPDPALDVGVDLVAVRRGDQRARLGGLVERAAQPDALGAADQLVDEALGDRFLDHQPGPGGADLPGVHEGRRSAHCRRRRRSRRRRTPRWGSCRPAPGPPSSRWPAAAAAISRPVASPPVKETRSTSGCSDSGAPASAPAPMHQVGDAGRQAQLLSSSSHGQDGGGGVSSAGLSTKVQPAASAGAIFHAAWSSG